MAGAQYPGAWEYLPGPCGSPLAEQKPGVTCLYLPVSRMESIPSMGAPPAAAVRLPVSIPVSVTDFSPSGMSPQLNPVLVNLKWKTMSFRPSLFLSSTWRLAEPFLM